LIYGQWTKEELVDRELNGTVHQPFQIGSAWYRVKELVESPLGAKYQAEQIEFSPGAEVSEQTDLKQPLEPSERPSKPEGSREVFMPPAIRSWARKKRLLGRVPRNGPAYLPREIRNAYREEFGEAALFKILEQDSQDARRIYAEEGDYPKQKNLYFTPSDRDKQQLSPEEVNFLYREIPKKSSEARLRRREEIRQAGKEVTDPIVQQRREALKGKTSS